MKKDDNKGSDSFQSDILFGVQDEGLEKDSNAEDILDISDFEEISPIDWEEDTKTPAQIVEFVLDVADSSIIDIADFIVESTLTDSEIDNDTFDDIKNDTVAIENETNRMLKDELSMDEPWAKFLNELRDDILSESSPKLRGAFLFLFSRVAAIFQQSEESVKSLTNLAQVSGFIHRSELLRLVAVHWDETGDAFLQALKNLEESDVKNEDFSGLRRSSILIERILIGGIPADFRDRLNQHVLPPETLRARFVLSLDSHRALETVQACRSWIRAASLSQSIKHTLRTLVAYLLQDSALYFDEVNPLIEKNNRAVLLISQNEAQKQGNMEKELDVLKRILGQDVRAGKELKKTEVETSERLKKDTTARLLRLTLLLSKLGDEDAAYAVLRDASNLSPSNTMVLRSLLRKAYQRNDAKGVSDAIDKLVLATKNRESRAVILERYAYFLQKNGADNEAVRTVLKRSLSEAPQCLPSLISYGQNLILAGEYPKMFFLRGGVESGNFQSVWRRAELLERTGASVEELVDLYQKASVGSPSNPHFFFSFERVLCRAGDWTSLKELYENALVESPNGGSENPLAGVLRDGNFDVRFYHLALSLYLEKDVSASLWGELDSYLSTRSGDPAVWEILREEVDSDPGRALGRLEILKQNLEDAKASETLRTLIWNVHIVGTRLQCGNQLGKVFEALLRSNSFYVSRIAAKGMVENQQLEKLAEMTVSEKRGLFWLSSEEKGLVQRKLVSAELLASTGAHRQAIDQLRSCVLEADNAKLRAEIGERALALSLQNNNWEGVLSFLPNIEEDVCALVRHLSVSIETSVEFLEEIAFAQTPVRDTTEILLSELELAYRTKNWMNALSVLTRCLRTLAAGTIDFRSFILQQACLISEWEDNDQCEAFLDDLWSLHNTKKNPPIFLVGAQIRYSARIGDEERLSKWQEIAKDVFAPSLAEALAEEAVLAVENTTPLEAAAWYENRFKDVYDSVKPYYKFMTATLRWGWEEHGKRDAQKLADAVAYGDPTHGVGDFLLAIGYRESGMMVSFEKQMLQIKERHFEPLQDWATTRLFFHQTITSENIQAGIDELQSSNFRAAPWSSILKELFLRSLKHESATDVLLARAKVATGGRAILLELAEIRNNKNAIEVLAEEGLISAQVNRFLTLATDSELDVDAFFESVKQKLIDDSDDAISAFTNYFEKVGPHFVGSPWCPLFLWRRYALQELSTENLESMRFYLDRVDDNMSSVVQLFFAQQYAISGDLKKAQKLSPPVGQTDLVSAAHDLFRYSVNPKNRQSAKTESDFWTARAEMMNDSLAGEAQYEIGRAYAQAGLEDEAIRCFEKSLGFNARFLPAQVAAGRALVHTKNWSGLARLWEQELIVIEDENLIASLSFRLGFLHLRRIETEESTQRAVEFFERVLRVKENHLPSIEALIEVGYQNRDFEMVVRYTAFLERFEESVSARCDRRVELAMLYELELQDHKQALSRYAEILELEPKRSDALFGLLRTDRSGELSVQALVRRLDLFKSSFDAEDIEIYLLLISKFSESAERVLKQRFPLSLPNLLARIIDSFEKGKVATDEIGTLGRMRNAELELFSEISTRMLQPHYIYSNENITLDPQHEGKLVALMHSAERASGSSAQNDELYLSTLGELAVARARRSKDAIVRVSEMTWMVCTLWIRGEKKEAQFAIEKLLSQFSDFGPAIKLAKFFAEENEDWESAARWYSQEIEHSNSVELISVNRVRLSQIQAEHLRDAASALEQLEQILSQEPAHSTAFSDLKTILLRQGEYQKLVGHFRSYVAAIQDEEEKKECFNEMAMISHQHLKDADNAILFYQSSIALDPDQPRELRILSEALERKERWPEAIVHYTAAAKLSDTKLKARIWNHVGELNEMQMKNDKEALFAYQNALKVDPNSPELFERIARTSEKTGDFEQAIKMLRRLLSTGVNETIKLNARIGLTRVGKKRGDSPKTFLKNIREVLLFHPNHQPSIEVARREISNIPGIEESVFFDELVAVMLKRDPVEGLKSAFNISHQLGQFDKAFCLASIAGALEIREPKLETFLGERTRDRRWPQKSIPREMANTLLPEDISPQVLEFLRLVREGIYVGLYRNPELEKVKTKHKVKNSKHLTLNLAERWPGVFNLPMSNLFVSDSVPSYSVVPDGASVKIVLNARWEKEQDPVQLLFPLGKELAAHSMGIAPWNEFDLDTQLSLLIAIIAKYVVEWNHVSRKHLPKNLDFMKTSKWLGKQDRRIAAYAIEISARHNAASLKAQLQTLSNALERFSGGVIDDPGRLIKANLLKKDTSAFPGAFFLTPEIQALRRELGIAIIR